MEPPENSQLLENLLLPEGDSNFDSQFLADVLGCGYVHILLSLLR